MKVKNPTKNTIHIVKDGVTYTVEPESFITGVPTEVANHWKTNTHTFIGIEDEVVEETIETPIEVKEEIKVEKVEEKEEEKSKGKKK